MKDGANMVAVSDVRKSVSEQRQRETRMVVGHPEIREEGDSQFRVCGFASVTEAPYDVNDWLGTYRETMARGAFQKTLQESADVRLLINHDGVPLARTKSRTLALEEITDPAKDPQGRGQTGLWCEATVDGSSPLAQTVRSAMSRGDLDEMSFSFVATRQEWNKDYTERLVTECRLFDVSIVTYPANPAASVQLNSEKIQALAMRMGQDRKLTDPEDVAVMTELLSVLSAIDTITDAAQESLADHLEVPSPDADEEPVEVEEPAGSESPVEDDAVMMGRANALAWAKRRAAIH